VGAYAGVINVAMMSGIPGAYGAVLKCESNSGVLNQVTAACLPSTIRASDITSLADMCNKVKPGVIKGLNPTVINDFNKTFSLPPGANNAQMKSIYAESKDTFSKIDPNWNTGSWNGEAVMNLSCVAGASTDYQRMMATSILSDQNATDDDHYMLAATMLGPTDVQKELSTQLPFLTALNTSTATLSPANITAYDQVAPNSAASNGVFAATPRYLTGGQRWTDSDEFAFKLIDKRYNGKLKGLLSGKGFVFNEWLAGRISSEEQALLNRCPYA
jgi:hypothetical protein